MLVRQPETESRTAFSEYPRIEDEARELLRGVRSLDGVDRVTPLTDFHFDASETHADSWVVELSDRVIPALADTELNCGIGLIDTGLDAEDFSVEAGEALLRNLWESSTSDEYRLSGDQVEHAFMHGLGSNGSTGGIPVSAAVRDAFELNGSALSSADRGQIDLDAVVPLSVRRMNETHMPTRLQIKGNHFIELQVVEDVVDPVTLRRLGLRPGRIVLMVHMGYRVTKFINYHYVMLDGLTYKSARKRLAFLLSRLEFHFRRVRNWQDASNRWASYFRHLKYKGLPLGTKEAHRYLAACAMATNYSFMGRALVYRMCIDAINRTWQPSMQPALICDTTHKSIRPQTAGTLDSAESVTIRCGAVEAVPGSPAIVAGHYDVPSLLGVANRSDITANSYDHGSANFRRSFIAGSGNTEPEDKQVNRYLIGESASSWSEARRTDLRVNSRSAMKQMARQLEAHGAVGPVAWLRPVANLGQV